MKTNLLKDARYNFSFKQNEINSVYTFTSNDKHFMIKMVKTCKNNMVLVDRIKPTTEVEKFQRSSNTCINFSVSTSQSQFTDHYFLHSTGNCRYSEWHLALNGHLYAS